MSGVRSGSGTDTGLTILEIILAIFVPPLSVFLTDGCGAQLLINILLTILAWFPGAIHAFWRIAEQRKRNSAAGLAPSMPAQPVDTKRY